MQKSQSQSPEKTSSLTAARQERETVKIAVASNLHAPVWQNEEVRWCDLKEKLSQVKRTKETVDQYRNFETAQKTKAKDVGAFVAGTLRDGRRRADAVTGRSLLTLDADTAAPTLFEDITMFHDFSFCMFSTHSHTPEQPRYRVLIPVNREMTPDEHGAVSRKVAEMLGMSNFDACSFRAAQMMFWPSCPKDGEFIYKEQISEDGEWLDVDAILDMYGDNDEWQDPLNWPRTASENNAHISSMKKQGDPMTKQGMIGAFNRTYSTSEAIETFLSDVYEQVTGDRYTYVHGTSAGGLVTYDDMFAYSHHGTDPCSDKLVNAFDMVRLHLFGALDDDSAIDTPIAKLPSTKAMKDFARNDKRVKAQVLAEKKAVLDDDFNDFMECVEESGAEQEQPELDLELDRSGNIIANGRNITAIFRHDIAPSLKYDTFGKKNVVVKPFIWDSPARSIRARGEVFNDTDAAGMLVYFAKVYDIEKTSMIENVLKFEVSKSTYHPVLETIESAKWDGIERAESLFIDYLGAEDNVYTREVTLKFLQHALKRLIQPGCAFPWVPVLEGPQGCGKSLIAARLALETEWFTDAVTDFRDQKKAGELLQGRWIAELSELAAMKKSEIEATKAFLSKTSDAYRGAYERYVSEYPRQSVFIATTNEDTYLKDKTGNRRQMPVKCDVSKRTKVVKDDFTHEVALQVWAEVLEMGVENISFELSDEAQVLAEKARGEKMIEDPTEIAIEEWVTGQDEQPETLTISKVAADALGEYGRLTAYERKAIVQAIEKLGYVKALNAKGEPDRIREAGRRQMYWKLIK